MDQYTYLVGIGLTSFIALGTAFFRWLNFKFNHVETTARHIEESAHEEFTKSRELQQKRHEENQQRFETITVAIARMGNGFKH